MIALIKLTCIVTQRGEHDLICPSDVHGEKMSSQLQSGEAGWNRQWLAVTRQSASVVGLGSAFFLCQTVFWHRSYPHILLMEHGHRVWHSLKVLQREKSSLSCLSNPQTFDPTPQYFCSFFRCVALAAVEEEVVRSFTQVKVTVQQYESITTEALQNST